MLARYDFVHRETDGFQSLKLLNLADHGGLINANERAARVRAEKMEKARAGGEPDEEADR